MTVLQDCEPIDVPGAGAEVVRGAWDSEHRLRTLSSELRRLDDDAAAVRTSWRQRAVHRLVPTLQIPRSSTRRPPGGRRPGTIQYLALGDQACVTEDGSTGRISTREHPRHRLSRGRPQRGARRRLEQPRGGEVPRHKVGGWAFVTQTFDVNSREDVEAVAAWLRKIESKDKTVIKLSFVGTISLREKALLDEELEQAGDLFAALDTWERKTELAVLPDESDLQRDRPLRFRRRRHSLNSVSYRIATEFRRGTFCGETGGDLLQIGLVWEDGELGLSLPGVQRREQMACLLSLI